MIRSSTGLVPLILDADRVCLFVCLFVCLLVFAVFVSEVPFSGVFFTGVFPLMFRAFIFQSLSDSDIHCIQ